MTKRPCIVDCNRIASIGLVAEHLLILIWGEGFLPYMPYTFLCHIWNIDDRLWVGGITVQHKVILSVYLSPTIYNLQHLYIRNIILVDFFTAYNLFIHIPQCITSGISIFIQINYTRIIPQFFINKNKQPEYYQHFSSIYFTRRVLPVLLKQNRTPIIVPPVLP